MEHIFSRRPNDYQSVETEGQRELVANPRDGNSHADGEEVEDLEELVKSSSLASATQVDEDLTEVVAHQSWFSSGEAAKRNGAENDDSSSWVELRVICALSRLSESSGSAGVVSSNCGRSALVVVGEGRAVMFDQAKTFRVLGTNPEVRVAVSDESRPEALVADVELIGQGKRAVWVEAVDAISGVPNGQLCISWRRVGKPASDETTRCADRLWEQFSSDGASLDHDDLRALVKAAVALGGNLMTLGGFERHGLIAYCVRVPEEDLFAYVLHRHCVLRVCYPPQIGIAALSTWQSRTVLVVVSLLWSFSANCLVSAIFIPDADRIVQIAVITFVDTFGVGVLTVLFYVAHSPCVQRACALCYRLNFPAIITTAFSLILVAFILVSITPDELYLAAYSFFPIYATARVTEIFKLGTYWAMQVQLGSLPPNLHSKRPD